MNPRTVCVDEKKKHLLVTYMSTGDPGTVVGEACMSAELRGTRRRHSHLGCRMALPKQAD